MYNYSRRRSLRWIAVPSRLLRAARLAALAVPPLHDESPHEAVSYSDEEEFLGAIASFGEEGLESDERARRAPRT